MTDHIKKPESAKQIVVAELIIHGPDVGPLYETGLAHMSLLTCCLSELSTKSDRDHYLILE